MEEKIEEILELIWTLREEGKDTLSDLKSVPGHEKVENLLNSMQEASLLRIEGDRVILLKPGQIRGEKIIRLHRLAEKLFGEVLEISMESSDAEDGACQFEHLLSLQVEESICTFLGHPTTCPHGKPIPPGTCCTKFRTDMIPLIARLCDLTPGERVRVSFVTPRFHSRFDRLVSLGITPGTMIKLHQNRPAFVVQVGESEIALDEEIAREIFVRRLPAEK